MLAKRVTQCIAQLVGFSDSDNNGIEPDDLLEGGRVGMDSLDKIELVMTLEEEFDIEIPDADAEQCETVGDVIAMVGRLTGEVAA